MLEYAFLYDLKQKLNEELKTITNKQNKLKYEKYYDGFEKSYGICSVKINLENSLQDYLLENIPTISKRIYNLILEFEEQMITTYEWDPNDDRF